MCGNTMYYFPILEIHITEKFWLGDLEMRGQKFVYTGFPTYFINMGTFCHVMSTEMGSHSLLQGIFLTQQSNPSLCTAGRSFTIWATKEAQNHLAAVWFESMHPKRPEPSSSTLDHSAMLPCYGQLTSHKVSTLTTHSRMHWYKPVLKIKCGAHTSKTVISILISVS